MNRVTSTLRVRWAGPAVLSVLIALAVTPRTAIATAPPPPVAAVTAAQACWQEAVAYLQAWYEYIKAWQDYQNTLPGGTEPEIMDSARRLDEASSKVADAGWKLVKCLAGMASNGPIIY